MNGYEIRGDNMGQGDILNVLRDSDCALSAHQISAISGLGYVSICRCLQTLLKDGFVDKTIIVGNHNYPTNIYKIKKKAKWT